MKLFDLHCDTLTECVKSKQELYSNNLSVSFEKGNFFENYVQTFAIWFPDGMSIKDVDLYYKNHLTFYKKQIDRNKDFAISINTAANFDDAFEQKKTGAVLSVEGGCVIGDDLKNIKKLKNDGVKLLTLTWNGENNLGFGCDVNSGLKPFGKQAVQELERQNIIVDVSHLSEKGFYDVAEIATQPFIASHSNAKAVFNHKRNLTDEQISIIKLNKGLIGVNFYGSHLSGRKKAGISDLLLHIDHLLSQGCEDVVALGSDYDGCDVIDDLKTVDRIEFLCENMKKCGYSDSLTEKIMFKNAVDFFKRNFKN